MFGRKKKSKKTIMKTVRSLGLKTPFDLDPEIGQIENTQEMNGFIESITGHLKGTELERARRFIETRSRGIGKDPTGSRGGTERE